MTYRIEISFDLRKTKNITEMKKNIRNIAIKNENDICFFEHEFGGRGRTINRNHVIAIIYFPEQQNLLNFIKNIKKVSGIYIESVGIDDCKFELIYASKKYLNFMDKFKAKDYVNDKKKMLLGPHKPIIKLIMAKV